MLKNQLRTLVVQMNNLIGGCHMSLLVVDFT